MDQASAPGCLCAYLASFWCAGVGTRDAAGGLEMGPSSAFVVAASGRGIPDGAAEYD